jgi:hypothetical protein
MRVTSRRGRKTEDDLSGGRRSDAERPFRAGKGKTNKRTRGNIVADFFIFIIMLWLLFFFDRAGRQFF